MPLITQESVHDSSRPRNSSPNHSKKKNISFAKVYLSVCKGQEKGKYCMKNAFSRTKAFWLKIAPHLYQCVFHFTFPNFSLVCAQVLIMHHSNRNKTDKKVTHH